MAYLIVTLHGKELQRRKLEGPTTIGRSLEADITLEDTAVSREHCRIEPDGERWVVVDLKSRNGTKVNGKTIERAMLKETDVIAAGHTKLRFYAGKFVGPRPTDPSEALLSDTTILVPSRPEISGRESSGRPLPSPQIGRVDTKPLTPQEAPRPAPLPFTRPPARPIVRSDEG